MTPEEIAIQNLQLTNAALVSAVNTTKSNIQSLIDVAVEDAKNETVLTLIQMSINSIKTQTLFLTFINQ